MRSAEHCCFSRWRALGSSFSRPLRQLPTDPKEAQCRGLIARRAALERYILPASSMTGVSRTRRKSQFGSRSLLGAYVAFAFGPE